MKDYPIQFEGNGIYVNHIDKWTAVDDYITNLLVPTDSILEEVLQVNAEANLPAHDVSIAKGEVVNATSDDPRVQGIRRFYE